MKAPPERGNVTRVYHHPNQQCCWISSDRDTPVATGVSRCPTTSGTYKSYRSESDSYHEPDTSPLSLLSVPHLPESRHSERRPPIGSLRRATASAGTVDLDRPAVRPPATAGRQTARNGPRAPIAGRTRSSTRPRGSPLATEAGAHGADPTEAAPLVLRCGAVVGHRRSSSRARAVGPLVELSRWSP